MSDKKTYLEKLQKIRDEVESVIRGVNITACLDCDWDNGLRQSQLYVLATTDQQLGKKLEQLINDYTNVRRVN